MHVCMYACMYICMYACVCACVCMYVCIYVCMEKGTIAYHEVCSHRGRVCHVVRPPLYSDVGFSYCRLYACMYVLEWVRIMYVQYICMYVCISPKKAVSIKIFGKLLNSYIYYTHKYIHLCIHRLIDTFICNKECIVFYLRGG